MLHIGRYVPGSPRLLVTFGLGRGPRYLPSLGSELTPEPSLAELLLSPRVFEFSFCSVHREIGSVHTQSVCDCVLCFFCCCFFVFCFLADSAFNGTCVEKKEKHLSVLFFVTLFLRLFRTKTFKYTCQRRQNNIINPHLPITWVNNTQLSAILIFRPAYPSYFVCVSIFKQNAGTILFYPS